MSADAGEERDVERVAQSIFHAGEQHFPDETGPVGWSNASPSERAASFILARAAITAYTSGGRDLFREGVEAAAKVADAEVPDWETKPGNPARRIAEAIRALSRK